MVSEEREAELVTDVICSKLEHELRKEHDPDCVEAIMEIIDFRYYDLIYETIEKVVEKEYG